MASKCVPPGPDQQAPAAAPAAALHHASYFQLDRDVLPGELARMVEDLALDTPRNHATYRDLALDRWQEACNLQCTSAEEFVALAVHLFRCEIADSLSHTGFDELDVEDDV